MALVDGAPSIRLEGDMKRALALVPEGRLLLSKVQGVLKRSGASTFSMNRRVDDDSYIYALVAGGQNIINISVAVNYVDTVEELPLPEGADFPDFLSGLVFDGVMEPRTKTENNGVKREYLVTRSFQPTASCARTAKLPTSRQANARLAVMPGPEMPEWNAPPNSKRVFSQYKEPRTSQWTGTMHKVVQIVFGLGRINKSKLRDPDKPKLATGYMKEVDQHGVRVRYDYKFMRTHGIYRAPDNLLWLIEISATRGVLAMPLPVFPGSRKANFLARAKRKKDDAMVTALEELGCLPTGESFPTSSDTLEKRIKEGSILRLLTAEKMEPFYRLSGYSSICGWAFNEKGDQAHNVGYYYPKNEYFQKGLWYQLNINISALKPFPGKNSPIANGSATLVKQQEGYLFTPPIKKAAMPLKYHEPLMDPPGLLSHSAKPLMGASTIDKLCDTVVFVSFVGNDLKVGKFFRSDKYEAVSESFDDRIGEECVFSGSWDVGASSGYRQIPPMCYTNDVDTRAALTENVMVGNYTSVPSGYTAVRYNEFIDRPQYGYLSRSRVFKETRVIEYRLGESRNACIVAPGYSRSAMYIFEGRLFASRYGDTLVSYDTGVTDPNHGVTYMYGTMGLPGPPPWPECDYMNCGGKNKVPLVMCAKYVPEPCGEFADSGPWLPQCSPSFAFTGSGVTDPNAGTYTQWDKGEDFTGSWTLVTPGVNGAVSGKLTVAEYEYAMRPSPDPDSGAVQQLYAQSSGIGEDCAMYGRGFFGEYIKDGTAAVPITEHDFMPMFIGVNK